MLILVYLTVLLSFCGTVPYLLGRAAADSPPLATQEFVGPGEQEIPSQQTPAPIPDYIFLSNEEREWLREHPVIRVVQDPAWPPFEFVDERGESAGITSDYLKLIEERLGIQFERVPTPSWQDAYERLKRWEIDMTTCVAETPERLKFWAFTKPYVNIPMVILTQTDVTFIATMHELAGKKVAVVDGYMVAELLPKDFPDIKMVKVATPREGLDLLQRGKVFAYIDNMFVVSYHLAKLRITNIKIAGETPYISSQAMAVRKDWAILAGILQKTLDSISESERSQILKKWTPIRYEHGFNYTMLWQAIAVFAVILGILLVWNHRLATEIRHRKEAETALCESETRMRYILNNVGINVFIKDTLYRYTYVNNKVCELFGLGEEEILGKSDDVFFSSDSVEEIRRSDRPVIERGEATDREESDIHSPGGDPRSYWTIKIPLRDSNGRIYGLCGISTDITERKRAEEERRHLEERLQRAEKMEALGTLAGGVAHDLNNVLGIIVGYSEMLSYDLGPSSPSRSHAMRILEGGQRAAAIVQDLLTLARRGVPSRSILNLNKVIMDVQSSPEFEQLFSLHPNVRIITDLEADLLNVAGSPIHLEKSLINLFSNAAEAMGDGGVIELKTRNRYLDRPVLGYDEVKEGDYVSLSLSDNGEGISPEDLRRIFEPFYTKKVMGRSGTGLGLSVVWGTVKDHRGYINVESEEGKGTTFTLYFPVTREELSPDRETVSSAEYMGKGESILVVDDVKEQRDLAVSMLQRMNYRPASAASGEEAVQCVKHHSFDLIILDMIMDPGMDGLDTFVKIREINPRQKAIIVSGFSETERVSGAQALGAGAYVKKPYVLEKLGMAVKTELSRSV